MSFQYINPSFYPKNQNYYSTMPSQGYVLPYFSNIVISNPYQTSIYNQGGIYPYMYTIAGLNGQAQTNPMYRQTGVIKTENNQTAYLFEMANGQKVAIMPRKDQKTIAKTFFNAGSLNENDSIRGLSHCIEHCNFKGSSKFEDGDVFKLTGLMGASTNASTDLAQTDYYISAPYFEDKDFEKTIEIQGDMLSTPRFDEAALESEKGPICSEISMINDDPTTSAYDKVIRNLFQIQSNSKNLVAGSIDTVQNLKRSDLVNHHQTYYDPKDTYTVVVGDVDVEKTINLIAKNFTLKSSNFSDDKKYKEPLNPLVQAKREDVRSSKTNNSVVMMAFCGPKPTNAKDMIIADMLDYYLPYYSSSNLKKGLDEMNAFYDADRQKVGLNKNDPCALVGVITTNPNDEQKAIDLYYDSIYDLQNLYLKDDDMQALKNYMLKHYEYTMTDSTSLCDILAQNMMSGSFDTFSDYKAIADSITKEDIMNFARKYYDLNKISMVVVHPTSVSVEDINRNYEQSKYSFDNMTKLKTSFNPKPIVFGSNSKKDLGFSSLDECVLPNNTNLIFNTTNSNLCVFNWNIATPPIKPKNPAIPIVLSELFSKGTMLHPKEEFDKYKELNAIDTLVNVNEKRIELRADCLAKDTSKTLELLNELIYNPNFSQSEFEKTKKYIKDVFSAAHKDSDETLLNSVYPGYFPTKDEILNSIDDLTLDDVKSFYNELLHSASSTFVASMPDEKYPFLKDSVKTYQNMNDFKFQNSTPKLTPIFEPNKKEEIIYDTDDLNQAQISKSYKFPLSGNIQDEVKFELVNAILGGTPNARLFMDLRDKQQLAYSVYSSINSFENTGILTLSILTTTDDKEAGKTSFDNVQKSLEGFKKHTDLLCRELVSDEELEAAKKRLKQDLIGATQSENKETALISMNAQEPYGVKRIDEYYNAIDKITKEDVKKAANLIFSQMPTTSILASEDTIKSQLPYLKSSCENVIHA